MQEMKHIDPNAISEERDELLAAIAKAKKELADLIDGGDECRGRDGEISRVIRILESATA